MAALAKELTRPIIAIEAANSADNVNDDGASTEGISVWQTLLVPDAPTKFNGIKSAARARQSDIERRLEKTFAVEHRLSEALRARRTYTDVKRVIAQSNIVTTVPKEGAEDLKVSYREQGNLEMYTPDKMKEREKNRHHPDVVGALDEFWNILPKLPNGKINKSIYVWMCRKMYFKLVRSATEEEFQAVVNEDWRNDALYSNSMNIRMFRTAMFTTADVWCETINPHEYRDFIRMMRRTVEAGNKFTGKLDDTEDELLAAAQRRERRRSHTGDLFERPAAGGAVSAVRGTEHNATNDDEPVDDDIAELLDDEEEAYSEYYTHDARAAAQVLRCLFDYVGQAERGVEEDIELRFGLTRAKRNKMFGAEDSDDAAANKEAAFEQSQLANRRAREQRRRVLEKRLLAAEEEQECLEIEGGSHLDRLAARAKQHESFMDEHLRYYNVARQALIDVDSLHEQNVKELAAFDKQRLKMKLQVHADPYDVEHVQYLNYYIAACERFRLQVLNVEDAHIVASVALTKDLENAASIMRSMQRFPLTSEAFKRHEGGKPIRCIEDVELSAPNWTCILEWFTQVHASRTDHVAGIIEGLEDLAKRVQTRETRMMVEWTKAQEENDTAILKHVQADKCVIGEHREATIREVTELLKQRSVQRNARVEALRAAHYALQEDIQGIKEEEASRLKEERRLIEAWAKASDFDQAAQAATEYVELLEATRSPSELAQTNFTKPKSSLTVSMGGTLHLPKGVTTPVELALFVSQQEVSWFGFYLERMGAERVRIAHNFSGRCAEHQLEDFSYMASNKLNARLRRVQDVDEYKKYDLEATDFGYLEKQLIKQRLEKEATYKELLRKTVEWKDSMLEERESYARVQQVARREGRVILARIFEVERTFRAKYLEVEQRLFGIAVAKLRVDRVKLVHAQGVGGKANDKVAARRAQRETEVLTRVQQRQVAAEKEARRREKERLAAEEKQKERMEREQKERNERAQVQRKRLLEEQERRHQERIKKEKEEKDRWQQEFLEQERQREKDAAEKKAWAEYGRGHKTAQLQPGGPRRRRASAVASDEESDPKPETQVTAATTNSPASVSLPKPATALTAPKQVRRKSTDGAPVKMPVKAAAKLPAKAPAKKAPAKKSSKPKNADYTPAEDKPTSNQQRASPHVSLKAKLEQSYGGDMLQSTSTKDLNDFAARRQYFLMEHYSNQDIYRQRCKDYGITPDSELTFSLSDESLLFSMTMVTVANRKAHIMSLLDVIMFNPVQHLYLRKAELDDDDVRHLAHGLDHHGFLSHLDLRNNAAISDVGGAFIMELIKTNSRVAVVKLQGTGVSESLQTGIAAQCEKNKSGRDIGRTEFEFIRDVFNTLDADHSGRVSRDELVEYGRKDKQTLATSNNSEPGSPGRSLKHCASTLDKAKMNIEDRVLGVRRQLIAMAEDEKSSAVGEDGFSLADLLCFVFPHWSLQDAQVIVNKYADGSGADGPSIDEMVEFVDTYGKNGALTLQQLAAGLGESTESLRTVFGEYDIDNDGRLSLDEFMRFMNA